MPRIKSTGLYQNRHTGQFFINKQISGKRYHFSTQTRTRAAAERVLSVWQSDLESKSHDAPELTFRDAAIQFLIISNHKGLQTYASRIAQLYPIIADTPLKKIDGACSDKITGHFLALGKKANTINGYLSILRSILRLCVGAWKTDNGDFWLSSVPVIKQLRVSDERRPCPISWTEQALLFDQLPVHLQAPVQFALHTGLRNREICNLRWSYLRHQPESGISYFLIPGAKTKNGKEHIVPLNKVVRKIIQGLQKNKQSDWVFLYQGVPMKSLRNDAWLSSVSRTSSLYESEFGVPCPQEFKKLRIHDLRHSFGHRLRLAGMNEIDMASLLSHGSPPGVTAHYATADISYLQSLVELIAEPPTPAKRTTLKLVQQSA